MKKDGSNPALLYAYGSYGASTEPGFDSNVVSLLSTDLRWSRLLASLQQAAPAVVPWSGTMSCVAFSGEDARTFTVSVAAAGERFEIRTGKPDEPGWLSMSGTRQADGKLQFRGTGISRVKPYTGQPFLAQVDGKLAGERYEGKGRLGNRDCTLQMARK